MSMQDVAKELQSLLAKIQNLGLWPPWEAAVTFFKLLARAVEVALFKPGPKPENITATANGWQHERDLWQQATDNIQTTRNNLSFEVWEGDAGDSCRSSLAATRVRFDSVVTATALVRSALVTCEQAISIARNLHGQGHSMILSAADPIDLWQPPWDIFNELKERVANVTAGIGKLISAYVQADAAITACVSSIRANIDGVKLPRHTADGMTTIGQTNLPSSSGGARQDSGPLRGTTAQRAQEKLDAMSPAEREEVQRLLDGAKDDTQRAWILAAVASGLTGKDLESYANQLSSLTPAQLRDIDPTNPASVSQYTQPDGTTCGSSSIVMSRMLNDPAYAMYIQTGIDPRGILPDQSGMTVQERFHHEALKMHDTTNTWWPQALGTLPGAVDEQMSHPDTPAGVPGTTYEYSLIDPKSPDQSYDAIVDAVSKGHTVPMYAYGINGTSGSGAHVTLVVAADQDTITVYNPGNTASGLVTLTREQFNNGEVREALGWDVPLTASLPKE